MVRFLFWVFLFVRVYCLVLFWFIWNLDVLKVRRVKFGRRDKIEVILCMVNLNFKILEKN